MDKKSFTTLEFDKILGKLAGFTQNEPVRERILSLCPTASLSEAKLWQSQTTEAVNLILRRGNPPGLKITDVTAALMRTERGGVLTMKELLAISALSKTARSVKRYLEDDKSLG
ncbi:MAG: hypothetical protein IJO50_02895, partial [Clostridia bacterium]|nr:hypothetical protein [Clostridia bacterium]